MSSGLYEIVISYGEGYKIDERSGFYFGELKEILPRISDGLDSRSSIEVRKVRPKTINMSVPKKSVKFYCYDDNLRKEIDFCEPHKYEESYFVYTPKETIKEFTFQDKILKIGDIVVFRDVYGGERHSGEILYFDYDNAMIKVLDGVFCYTIPVINVENVYDGC